jgi:quinol monooxygenase YgiN
MATASREDGDVSTEISWALRADVKPGKVEVLRALMDELVASTMEEAGTRLYEWFISGDETAVHIHERYVDSPAALAHCTTFAESYAERFLACVDPREFDVYGEPDEPTREAIAGFDPVPLRRWGGFARFS